MGLRTKKAITLVSGATTLTSIDSWPGWYVRPQDIILITDPAPVNVSNINSIVAAIRANHPDNPIYLRTFGLESIEDILDSTSPLLSPEITGISYIYEDRTSQGDEPEFSDDFTETLANYDDFVALMAAKGGGRLLVTEPSGRGLPYRDYTGWDYGEIAAKVDLCLVQSQRNAKLESEATTADAFADAITSVAAEMAAEGITEYGMQISIGGDTNSIASGDDAFAMFELAAAADVPIMHMWPQQSQITEFKEFFDTLSAALDPTTDSDLDVPTVGRDPQGGVLNPNLLPNGGFDVNFDGWVAENGTGGRVTTEQLFGDGCAYFVATTPSDSAGIRTTDYAEVATDDVVTSSCYIRSYASTQLSIRIAEYDSGDNFLRLGGAVNAAFTDSGEYQRISVTATMGADTARIRVYINTWGSQTAEFRVDGAKVELGAVPTTYARRPVAA